jgi:hypothetical protein
MALLIPFPRLVSVLLLLTLGAHAASAPVWLKVHDDNFTIYTDGSPADLLDFALRYKAYQLTLRELFVAPGKPLPPTVLVLFKRYGTLSDYLPAKKSKDDFKLVSYSVDGDGVAFAALSLSEGRNTAFEQCAQFETIWSLKRLGYELPVWAAQGAGTAISSVRVSRGKYVLGELPDNYASDYGLRSDGYPWERFFAISRSSPEYNETRQLWRYGGQACMLMNWILFADDQAFERVGRLARKLQTSPGLPAVEAVMQVSAAKLTSAINEHLSRRSRGREKPFDEAAVRAALKVTTAGEAEILAQTAVFLGSGGKPELCDGQLARAFVLEPGLPLVKEARARRAADGGDFDEAVRLYREAIEKGSVNPVAYLRSATARLNRSSTDGTDQMGSGGLNATNALAEIRQAIVLSHGSTEAYTLFGRACYLLPKVSADLLPELAAGLTPGEDTWRVRYYYALLHERVGNTDECFAEMKKILALPDLSDATRRQVERQTGLVRYRVTAAKVKALVEENQLEAAMKLLADGQAMETDDSVITLYRRLGSWVRQREASP